jgi:hypothetical protein
MRKLYNYWRGGKKLKQIAYNTKLGAVTMALSDC